MTEQTTVSVVRLPHGAGLSLPRYATKDSVGLDVMAAIGPSIEIRPMERILIPSGFKIAMPSGYEAQIRPRSGLAVKHGITVLNSPGTIDPDYRGEVKICLINLGSGNFIVERGMRIAQMVIGFVTQVKFQLVEKLEITDRDESGFGSTGLSG